MPLTLNAFNKPIKDDIEHERLTSLINSMADAVIAVDEEIKINIFNSAALNILDINNIEEHTPLRDLLKPMDKNGRLVDIEELIKTAKLPITNRDLSLFYNDGSKINVYLAIAPVHLGYGNHDRSGYVLLIRDITREKSLEEERDEFISVVSHELRTPITIAEGNLSNAKMLVEKSNISDLIKKAIHESHKQILYLAEMINDLSTLSRAERNILKIDIEKINIHDLITELIASYTPDAEAKHLHLKSVIDPNIPDIYSSRLYVREILQNFVTNALKYTEKGEIVVHAEIHERGVLLSVHDSGIGISRADQERVFDKFFRSEDFRTRAANGTGLGLYVTLKLANLIRGEINLDSQLNKGSTFSIYVPDLR